MNTLGNELSFPSEGLFLSFHNSPAVRRGLEAGGVVPEEGPLQQDSRGQIVSSNSQPIHAESSDDAALALEELEQFIDESFRGFIGYQTIQEQGKKISILRGAIRGRCEEPARHSTPELGGRHTISQGPVWELP